MRLKKMKSCQEHNSNCIQPKLTAFDCICNVGIWTFDHTLLKIWHLYVEFLDATAFSEFGSTGFGTLMCASLMTIVFLGIVGAILLVLFVIFGIIVLYTKVALIAIGIIVTIVGLAYAASKCSNY